MARVRKPPTSDGAPALSATKQRAPLKEKTNVARTRTVYSDDGNTEGLVKESRRGRLRLMEQSGDLMMAGALGNANSPSVASLDEAHPNTDKLTKSGGIANPSPRRTRARKLPRTHQDDQQEAQMSSKQCGRPRGNAPGQTRTKAAKGAATTSATSPSRTVAPHSELSISPSSPCGLSSARGPQGTRSSSMYIGSVFNFRGTPAAETSTLALKQFKRRPRQPSMLAMVQQHQQAMKARELTLDQYSVQRKERREQTRSSDVEDNLESEGEDDFVPDAEGTPLRPYRETIGSRLVSGSPVERCVMSGTAPSRKRKSADLDQKPHMSSAERLRLRNREAHQGAADDSLGSQMIIARPLPSSSRQKSIDAAITSEVQVINSSPDRPNSTPPTEPRSRLSLGDVAVDDEDVLVVPITGECRRKTLRTRRVFSPAARAHNATMLEPASSSPNNGSSEADPIKAYPATLPSQHDPLPSATTQAKRKRIKPLTTSALQNLLPKRRRAVQPMTRKSVYNFGEESTEESLSIYSESEAGDNDSSRQPRDRRKIGAAKTARRDTGPSTAAKARQKKNNAAASRSKTAVTVPNRKSTIAGPGQHIRRTYGKPAPSKHKPRPDDGNYSDAKGAEGEEEYTLPEVSITSLEAAQSKEIIEAKRKFDEIDAWDGLEFESIEDEHRSSSQGWR